MNINMTKLFNYLCKNGHLEDAQWLYQIKPSINISANNEEAFRFACHSGHLQVAQWLYEIKPISIKNRNINIIERVSRWLYYFIIQNNCVLNISAENEFAFRGACTNGHLEVAQWLYQIKPTLDISEEAFRNACYGGHLEVAQWLYQIKPTLNISECNEYAFQCACGNGHLLVAQWLYQVKPTLDISADNEFAFLSACVNGHIQVAQWLQSLNPNTYIIINNFIENNKIQYRIINTLNKSKRILHKEHIELCPICSETVCDIQTACNHTFCESCIQTWVNSNQGKTCPYCRTCLTNTVFQPIATR